MRSINIRCALWVYIIVRSTPMRSIDIRCALWVYIIMRSTPLFPVHHPEQRRGYSGEKEPENKPLRPVMHLYIMFPSVSSIPIKASAIFSTSAFSPSTRTDHPLIEGNRRKHDSVRLCPDTSFQFRRCDRIDFPRRPFQYIKHPVKCLNIMLRRNQFNASLIIFIIQIKKQA